MSIPDSVLAAIIAGTATLSASFVQLRSALLREAAGRASSASRRRNRMQLLILLAIIGAAGVCGFALSQWLTAGERAAQSVMQRELQARVAELGHAASELEQTRGSERGEIENGVLRRLGTDGIVVMASVPACRPPSPASASPAGAAAPTTAAAAPAAATEVATPARPCTEAEASAVALCASIPSNASVTEVALFSRTADSNAPWSASRYLPGQESGEARFAPTYSESTPEGGARQVCQEFAHWSSAHARIVRMVVRYSLPV
ncbi:MAG TPA: hypothetical protein VMT66_11900 [Steroidobacteraceae bacterium]|nr:hypothetical protein [Steroidobacteraceae bacterium]